MRPMTRRSNQMTTTTLTSRNTKINNALTSESHHGVSLKSATGLSIAASETIRFIRHRPWSGRPRCRHRRPAPAAPQIRESWLACLLYTSDAADEEDSVDL